MRVRRLIFATAVLSTISFLMLWMAKTLSPGGLDSLEWALLLCFGLTLPWTTIGFWNGFIGLPEDRSVADDGPGD